MFLELYIVLHIYIYKCFICQIHSLSVSKYWVTQKKNKEKKKEIIME